VILLDFDLPGLQGFETVRRLSTHLPSTRVLLLTDYLDSGLASEALLAGAAGCVVRLTAGSVLVEAILAVSRGQFYIQPEVLRELLSGLLQQPGLPDEQTGGITPLEADLLRLEARGCTKRQIACVLGISAPMVDRRRAEVMAKLGLRCRADRLRDATALGSGQAASSGSEPGLARLDP
jgi:DNA-binding NarL/FixJ family response regulator